MPEIVASYLSSGRLIDLILAFMLIEGIALIAYQRVTKRGIAPASLIKNLLAGGCILLAFRAALAGWGIGAITACLGLSFAAHLADLQDRWKSR
jgi:hypothetical protein